MFLSSEYKRQLWRMKVESGKTIHRIVGEALNALFAKYGKPEIIQLDEEWEE